MGKGEVAPAAPDMWTDEAMATAIAGSDIKRGDVVFCKSCREMVVITTIQADKYRSEEEAAPSLSYNHWDNDEKDERGCSVGREVLLTKGEVGPLFSVFRSILSEFDTIYTRMDRLEEKVLGRIRR